MASVSICARQLHGLLLREVAHERGVGGVGAEDPAAGHLVELEAARRVLRLQLEEDVLHFLRLRRRALGEITRLDRRVAGEDEGLDQPLEVSPGHAARIHRRRRVRVASVVAVGRLEIVTQREVEQLAGEVDRHLRVGRLGHVSGEVDGHLGVGAVDRLDDLRGAHPGRRAIEEVVVGAEGGRVGRERHVELGTRIVRRSLRIGGLTGLAHLQPRASFGRRRALRRRAGIHLGRVVVLARVRALGRARVGRIAHVMSSGKSPPLGAGASLAASAPAVPGSVAPASPASST